MNIVIGSRGRLGSAIAASLGNGRTLTPTRSVYAEWSEEDGADAVFRYVAEHSQRDDVVYMAAGLIDTSAAPEEHLRVNFRIPRNIIVGASRANVRVVTFGTIMERFIGDAGANPYISAKTKLGKFVSAYAASGHDILHVRLHTLFGGGTPHDFMFLGQIFNALKNRSLFRMSSGTQLREYHHIDDDVAATRELVSAGLRGVVDLSHGQPISLRDLASHIFEACDCLDLLRIGALPSPASDNYEITLERTPALRQFEFQDTLPAVVSYLRDCLDSSRNRR